MFCVFVYVGIGPNLCCTNNYGVFHYYRIIILLLLLLFCCCPIFGTPVIITKGSSFYPKNIHGSNNDAGKRLVDSVRGHRHSLDAWIIC